MSYMEKHQRNENLPVNNAFLCTTQLLVRGFTEPTGIAVNTLLVTRISSRTVPSRALDPVCLRRLAGEMIDSHSMFRSDHQPKFPILIDTLCLPHTDF